MPLHHLYRSRFGASPSNSSRLTELRDELLPQGRRTDSLSKILRLGFWVDHACGPRASVEAQLQRRGRGSSPCVPALSISTSIAVQVQVKLRLWV